MRLNTWRKRGIIIVFMTLLLMQTWTTHAASAERIDFTLGCTGLISQGATITLNRDNTGNNQELFTMTAYDGNGQVLFSQTSSFIVGGGFVIPSGRFFGWEAEPNANPLSLVISSNAGNGHAEQVVYRQSGICNLITTQGNFQSELTGLPDLTTVDGTSSPSVPIGIVPPRVAGNTGIANLLGVPGYGIVNTTRLNLRTGAGVQYTRIALLSGGTEVLILGHNPAETWWYVQVDTVRGWVSGEYVALRGNVQEVNIVPGIGELEPARFIFYSSGSLYGGPSLYSNSLCQIAGNIEYQIVGRTALSDWYQIQTNCGGAAVTGWVNTSLGAVRTSGAIRIPVTG